MIACIDGQKGFPDAINTVYLDTQIQLCIVHKIRNSIKYVPWKDYKAVTADLKHIYQSTAERMKLYLSWINFPNVGMANILR